LLPSAATAVNRRVVKIQLGWAHCHVHDTPGTTSLCQPSLRVDPTWDEARAQAEMLPEHPALQSLLHTATDPRRGVAIHCSPLRRTIDTAGSLYAVLQTLTPTTLALKPFLAEVRESSPTVCAPMQ
jgi:hypothetical protein